MAVPLSPIGPGGPAGPEGPGSPDVPRTRKSHASKYNFRFHLYRYIALSRQKAAIEMEWNAMECEGKVRFVFIIHNKACFRLR